MRDVGEIIFVWMKGLVEQEERARGRESLRKGEREEKNLVARSYVVVLQR